MEILSDSHSITSRATGTQLSRTNNLLAWIAWRPDELLMLSGYFPFWGASLLVYLADAEPVLFVPQIEPRDHIPAGLRVQEYPWGDLKCADPYSVLLSAVSDELGKAGIPPRQVGMNPGGSRASLPIQAAEQIPIPDDFAAQLSRITAEPDAQRSAGFLALYLRKAPEEVAAIRLANRVANIGLRAFARESETRCHGGRSRGRGGIVDLSADRQRWDISFPRMGHGAIRSLQRGCRALQSLDRTAAEDRRPGFDRAGNLREWLLERPDAHRASRFAQGGT